MKNNSKEKIQVFGVTLSNLTRESARIRIRQMLTSGIKQQLAITVNAEFLVEAQRNPKFRAVLKESALSTADGIGVLWLAKYLSLKTYNIVAIKWIHAVWQLIYTELAIIFAPDFIRSVIREKIPGTELVWDIAEAAEDLGLSVFLAGGWGDTPELAASRMHKKFPTLKIAGTFSGKPEDSGLIEKISSTKPDILLVAFGPVRQEMWLYHNLKKTDVLLGIGLGGTFDYIAGKKPLAPRFLRYIGLEWAFRLVTQPYRIKRIFRAVITMPWYGLLTKIQELRPYRPNVACCIINEEGKLLVCRRKRSEKLTEASNNEVNHWQIPQGGIDIGETPQKAVKREMMEEVGLSNFEILGSVSNAYTYEWPLEISRNLYGGNFRGQSQSIFYLQIDTRKSQIKLDHDEFDDYKWVKADDFLPTLHPMRRELGSTIIENLNKFYKNG